MQLTTEDIATLQNALDASDLQEQAILDGAESLARMQTRAQEVFAKLPGLLPPFNPDTLNECRKRHTDAALKQLEDNALARAKLIQLRRFLDNTTARAAS
jgi:hypothetical protein